MGEIRISTDEVIFWQSGWLSLNATILFTWITIAVLVVGAVFVRRQIGGGDKLTTLQNLLEVLVEAIRKQIREISGQDPAPFVPFIGSLFLLIATSAILGIVPGYLSPTASLSTTAALATCVFFSVPYYGIRQNGTLQYFGQYIKPTVLMLPFNIIGELSRTLALAVRLYGNMMSAAVIGAVLLMFVPLLVPVLMQALGLITGMIQAYIFAVLAMVYIASAIRVRHQRKTGVDNKGTDTQSGDFEQLAKSNDQSMTGET
jgi:F-type H+-transporting ATPase subunit a